MAHSLMTSVLLLDCLVISFAAERCYGDLGCFTDETFCSDNNFPPWDPSTINTQFYLYTRNDKANCYQLDRKDSTNIAASGLDPTKKIKFISHGFTDSVFTTDFMAMKDAVLDVEDCNVILVDWSRGADALYDKARQNIRVVGRELALLARILKSVKGASYEDMHCIGHSLGAHMCGYAGEWQPGFGRITGLDPAGPGYRNVYDSCKLDTSDAIFVDNIHTDADPLYFLGFGIEESLGHVDIFPNGGYDMPGCFPLDPVCDHSRAVLYFIDSITSTCRFTAYKCNNYDDFKSGGCSRTCGMDNCTEMGYYADISTATGNFYLITNRKSPFCY